MIQYVIADSDDVVQSNNMPFRYPQVPVLEWPQNFHDIMKDCPFMLCCEEWPVLIILCIDEPHTGDFS